MVCPASLSTDTLHRFRNDDIDTDGASISGPRGHRLDTRWILYVQGDVTILFDKRVTGVTSAGSELHVLSQLYCSTQCPRFRPVEESEKSSKKTTKVLGW